MHESLSLDAGNGLGGKKSGGPKDKAAAKDVTSHLSLK